MSQNYKSQKFIIKNDRASNIIALQCRILSSLTSMVGKLSSNLFLKNLENQLPQAVKLIIIFCDKFSIQILYKLSQVLVRSLFSSVHITDIALLSYALII